MKLPEILCLCTTLTVASGATTKFRVLTFNTLFTGGKVDDGLAKVAATVMELKPDIVLMQEVMTVEKFDNLLTILGRNRWSGVTRKGSGYSDTGILTPHYLDLDTVVEVPGLNGIGVQVRLGPTRQKSNLTLNVWCIHFDYANYGPQIASDMDTTSSFQILAGEYNFGELTHHGRAQDAIIMSQFWPFLDQLDNSDKIPVIFGGDFNAPSHLDWVESTRSQHYNWTFEWPSTKILNENLGLIDSYRELYPDPAKDPGITWTSLAQRMGAGYVEPQPLDRIDMVHYKGASLKPTFARTYKGHATVIPFPYQIKNDYPSDHLLMYVDFQFTT